MIKNNFHVNFFKISSNFSGQRIDNFLRVHLKSVPKSKIYQIIRTGEVRINCKRIKFTYKLKIGDILRIPPVYCKITNQYIPRIEEKIKFLQNIIIYEDEYILVINKPCGLAVHGGTKLCFGVIEGLRILRPSEKFLELVHRLDRGTSGVLLIAKTRTALVYLHEQLRLNKMKKIYLALVYGAWDTQIKEVSIKLFKNHFIYKNICVVDVNSKQGQFSKTFFRIRKRFGNFATLLSVQPITGRTHQIRIHTQYVGHPIIGDCIYGKQKNNNILNKKFGCLNRLCLHASSLYFLHPYTKHVIHMYAPMDQSFLSYLRVLNYFCIKNTNILKNNSIIY